MVSAAEDIVAQAQRAEQDTSGIEQFFYENRKRAPLVAAADLDESAELDSFYEARAAEIAQEKWLQYSYEYLP